MHSGVVWGSEFISEQKIAPKEQGFVATLLCVPYQ
jgi:hypothetical protein